MKDKKVYNVWIRNEELNRTEYYYIIAYSYTDVEKYLEGQIITSMSVITLHGITDLTSKKKPCKIL